MRLGRENLDAIEETVTEHRIDCDFRRSGSLSVATESHQVAWLREEHTALVEHGRAATWLDGAQVRARVASPSYLAGVDDPDCALVEPVRLAWGLRAACPSAGVRIFEGTPVVGIEDGGRRVAMRLESGGRVVADRVVLATNAFRPLLRRLRLMTVPRSTTTS